MRVAPVIVYCCCTERLAYYDRIIMTGDFSGLNAEFICCPWSLWPIVFRPLSPGLLTVNNAGQRNIPEAPVVCLSPCMAVSCPPVWQAFSQAIPPGDVGRLRRRSATGGGTKRRLKDRFPHPVSLTKANVQARRASIIVGISECL